MAISRPKAIGDAPAAGRSAAEDGGGETFLPREEWAEPRGRKSHRRRCGSGDRGAAGLRPDQAKERPCVRVRRTASWETCGRDIGSGRTRGPAFHCEGIEALACNRADRWAPPDRRFGQRPPPASSLGAPILTAWIQGKAKCPDVAGDPSGPDRQSGAFATIADQCSTQKDEGWAKFTLLLIVAARAGNGGPGAMYGLTLHQQRVGEDRHAHPSACLTPATPPRR